MTAPGPNILYGVCGIGLGHLFRQLPVLEHCARIAHRMMVFAFDRSYEYLSTKYSEHPRIRIEKVEVPFFAGDLNGLSFETTRTHPANLNRHFFDANCAAMERACRFLGRPTVVISDYEPISAQVAYAYGAPLVTVDQQSKYLLRSEWPFIGGCGCTDEVMRLRMFFPKAACRFACSFFSFTPDRPLENVQLIGPIMRNDVLAIKQRAQGPIGNEVIVYISAQQVLAQPVEEIISILSRESAWTFHVFLPHAVSEPRDTAANVVVYRHGSGAFEQLLGRSSALVTTAGHSLLSEAMHLGIPAYAMPLPVYEQHMNALEIAGGDFGIAQEKLEPMRLREFLERIADYRKNIQSDSRHLLRGPGQSVVVAAIDSLIE